MSRAKLNSLLLGNRFGSDSDEDQKGDDDARKNVYFTAYSDPEFIRKFLLKKTSVLRILKEISDDILFFTASTDPNTPMTQFLLTLRFFATGSFAVTVADFDGMSVETAVKIVKRVSNALTLNYDGIIKPKTPVGAKNSDEP
ncbi:uncharacterized protein LOC112599038 [Melanaphis sacchari]|uniref:uncharacterized protein LOC112599038 n=1 Tax=Melanaphis sacchari TaxID=742174 RepID=UPI000DC14033|nr:uncharacterized protein LOC112599038 [Melanaphis sacchari]